MFEGPKLELVQTFTSLIKKAKEGKDHFPDDVCNFISNEFELQAAVLFKIENQNELTVLGRSSSAKKNFMRGGSFTCTVCTGLKDTSEFSFNSDSKCELQISEFLVYESCIKFSIDTDNKGFLKLAKKKAFAKSDSDALKNISAFIGYIISLWMQYRGDSNNVSGKSFFDIINTSANELRNPVNTIVGFTSILAEDNITSSQEQYISTIKKNAQNVLAALNDLNDLTKMETEKVDAQIKEIEVKSFLKETIDVFKGKVKDNSLIYNLDVDSSVPEKLDIDDKKLKTVLNNLITISTRLTPKGKISLDVSHSFPNRLKFVLSDEGKGLTKDKCEKFFDPFALQSVDELKSLPFIGLGLTLTQKIIKKLGGTVSVESELDKGTKFNFHIRVASIAEGTEQVPNLPKPSSHNKILVIEDDYATSKLLSNYLTKWGYDPTIVNTADQTMELLQSEKYLAVILDIELPQANGLELLRKIRQHPNSKNTPVIVCSVEAEQQKAFLMGAVEYFVKPINYNYLVEVLTSYKLRKSSNVLCVDDDVPTLNLVKQAIETAGYNPIAEHISANVLELIKGKEIDLAIIDLDMPHPNGFELIKLIKSEKQFEKLPIIIYTGKENYAEDLKNIDGLFDELLDKKSTNIEDLAETINSMINRYETPPTVEEVMDNKEENVVKILLAEDYKHSQIIVTRLLKKNGFENVAVVENGEEALNLAKKDKTASLL
ncbi:MAG: response regulator [Melioribacteraceae bacterium]|nr:response regulator [Melioribacteraceae bacterium]MCF8355453.1 response regulator [Melioribacteraceae bacterium]MCF8395388.1 response regulator [Melioribacteraceae bacterium]MCF8420481.1 response regulator [Melioribacteraceae bacterium]